MQQQSHFPRAASAVSFFSQRSLSCADLFELDEQGQQVEEALGDLSTTDTSDAGDGHGAPAEDAGINESQSRNDLRRIHTMETFSWQGYSMQQQNQKSLARADQGDQAQINLPQSAAYPPSYAQESSSQWSREHRGESESWSCAEWPSDSTALWAGSPMQGQGVGSAMPAHNPFLRATQANAGGSTDWYTSTKTGVFARYLPNTEAKYQPNWYAGAPPAPPAEDRGHAAFRHQEQQQEVPSKQPSIVPVPVPVMLGPNGTMIPVPMGANGMGALPQQSLAQQLPHGIPPMPQGEMGQQMVFLRPNGAQGMPMFGFVGVPPQQAEAPKKQVKEQHTDSGANFGDDITLMLRNLPNKINQTKLLSRLQSYRNKIDFLYLPTDFENKCNLGYAFINFVDGAAAARFKAEFNDKKLPGCRRSHKVLAVQPARVQGVSANVRRFRNSSVMGVLSEEEKPMLFKDGVQIPFPMPDGPLPPVGPRYPRDGEPSAA
jgi:hypothetical protein